MNPCTVGPLSSWKSFFFFFDLIEFSSPEEVLWKLQVAFPITQSVQIPLFATDFREASRKADFLLSWCVPHLLAEGLI